MHHIIYYPEDERTYWRSSLKGFMRRLRWDCHFIQKLEDQPSIKFHPLQSAANDLWLDSDENQQ